MLVIKIIFFGAFVLCSIFDANLRWLWLSILFVWLALAFRKMKKLYDEKNNEENNATATEGMENIENEKEAISFISPKENNYTPPSLELLKKKNKTETENIDKSKVLTDMLFDFNIACEVVNIEVSNVFTRYELKLERGIKLSKIEGLQKNIALALGSSHVRIFTIEDKGTVAIETANTKREIVTLREVLENEKCENMVLPVALGKVVGNGDLIFDLAAAPHLLIAGSTGSGKSVCLNSIILSLVYRLTPNELRFIFIDKKRVELSLFNTLPHLACETLTTDEEALRGLTALSSEMKRRYTLLERHRVRNIESYNKKAKEEKRNTLPSVVLVIDELYNLFAGENRKEIEGSLTELASMSRAVGIHIVAATQRPSADVITGVIKMNMPARIAFKVPSKINSRIILDEGGAEALIGKGDGLFQIDDQKCVRFQGAFVDDDEVSGIITHFNR